MTLTSKKFTQPSPKMNNTPSKSTTSTTVSLSQSTAQLLDLFISKQTELKKLEAFIGEVRKQLQMAAESGELDPIKQNGNYFYDNLQIQVVERKSWKYSAAVDALKEQEQFNGNATQSTNATYRFLVQNSNQSN